MSDRLPCLVRTFVSFFFSSRRRHTRCSRDWSSDVCSSDLQPPEGLDLRGLEKSTTEKAKVVEALKASFAHVRQATSKLTDADLDKTAPWFGDRQASYREILFFLAAHQHEHLGQSIAYARINGVIPPWTEERQQQQQSLKQPEKPKQ